MRLSLSKLGARKELVSCMYMSSMFNHLLVCVLGTEDINICKYIYNMLWASRIQSGGNNCSVSRWLQIVLSRAWLIQVRPEILLAQREARLLCLPCFLSASPPAIMPLLL